MKNLPTTSCRHLSKIRIYGIVWRILMSLLQYFHTCRRQGQENIPCNLKSSTRSRPRYREHIALRIILNSERLDIPRLPPPIQGEHFDIVAYLKVCWVCGRSTGVIHLKIHVFHSAPAISEPFSNREWRESRRCLVKSNIWSRILEISQLATSNYQRTISFMLT